MTRRELFRFGLAGTALSWLGRGCQRNSNKGADGGTNPPEGPEPVYRLSDGQALYDDFDGHGNLQTYDGQNLAEAGKISSRIWNAWTGWGTGDVIDNPVAGGLLTVLNEDGQRVEYRTEKGTAREIKSIYGADGRLIDEVPHLPGEPYHGARRLLWLGARDGGIQTPAGPVAVRRGQVYGLADTRLVGTGNVLRLAASISYGEVSLEISNPAELEFADNKSFSADMMLSSSSTARRLSAILDYHTTIPDQPPGKSWFSQIGIGTVTNEDIYLVCQYGNVNLGYRFFQYLGSARWDTWYNLRMDMVTREDDAALGDKELRIDYYVNGRLLVSSIPEDSEVVLDPQRTGAGPSRILTVRTAQDGKSAVACYDNVRAVYNDRIS